MIKKRYILASTIFHLLPILLFLGAMVNSQPSSSSKNEEEITEKPEEKTIEVSVLPQEEGDGDEPKQVPKKKAEDCEKFFGGIGIDHDERTGLIIKAHPGYPADRAGLKAYDQIINPKTNEIRGEVGTQVLVVVYRSSTAELITVTLTREKICLKGRP